MLPETPIRQELNDYKIGRLMFSISTKMSPFTLNKEFLSHAVLESEKPFNPKFLDISRLGIESWSLANRINVSAMKMPSKRFKVPMSPETLKRNVMYESLIIIT